MSLSMKAGAVALPLAVALCVAASAAAAVPMAGTVIGWGDDSSGQLGYAPASQAWTYVPVAFGLPAGAGAVTQANIGPSVTLLLSASGQAYALGDNRIGALGNTENNGADTVDSVPVAITLPGESGTATGISEGDSDSAVVTSSGQLYMFGWNNYGQLGNATNNGTSVANPTPTPVTFPGTAGVASVSAGYDQTLAVMTSGQLYAFGENEYGEIGTATNVNTYNPNPTPVLVPIPASAGHVVAAAAGSYFSLALTSTGQLFGFGYNGSGQLGNGTNAGANVANYTPLAITLPGATGPAIRIAAGDSHALVLTSTGQLYSFGDNEYGELGTTTNVGTIDPNSTPALVTLPGLVGAVTQIAAGDDYSAAVTSSGQLYTWGANSFGQLGSATNFETYTADPTPQLVAVPGGATIDTVVQAGDGESTLALVSDLGVTTTTLPAATTSTPYSAQLASTGGTAPITWSASGLPTGLNVNASTGVISGTPTTVGTANVTVTATDIYGGTVSAPLNLTTTQLAPTLSAPNDLAARQRPADPPRKEAENRYELQLQAQ
jgi:alpha-tubulin suppressor-like RCC1 family protein